MTRDELRERLKQRREEMASIQQKLDEAQKLVDSKDVTDAQLAEKMEAMRSSARWLFFGGFGEGRGGGGGGGGARDVVGGPDGMMDDEDRPGGRAWGPWGPRGDETDWSKPITAEDVKSTMAWVDEHMPRLSPRLKELEKSDPDALKRIIQRMRPRVAEMQRMSKENPEAAKIRIAEWQSGMRVVDTGRVLRDRVKANAPEAEIEKARADVRAALAEQFDAQLKLQESEIDQLKARVARAEKRIDERRPAREQWLTERLKEIESGKDRHWGGPSSGEGKKEPGL